MKKKKIKDKLNMYADSLERKEEILYGAYHAMDTKRSSEAYGKNNHIPKRRFRLASLAAAAVIFVIAIGIALNNLQGSISNNTPGPSISPYSLSSLQKQTVSQEDYYDLTDVMFIEEETDQIDARFIIYTNEENEIYAAKALYKILRNGSIDQVTIVSDLKNKLTDYEKDKPSKNNSVVRHYDVYKDGEYHSYLATLTDNITYYITIASPTMHAGTYYENILL